MDDCPTLLGDLDDDLTWAPLDWSHLSAADFPAGLEIFVAEHPELADGDVAFGDGTISVPVEVYLTDSKIWTEPEQLAPYAEFVNRYYAQARIHLDFSYPDPADAPELNDNLDTLTMFFAEARANPSGNVPDGFGNLPTSKGAINDQLMDRPNVHENPYFLMGKPFGHEIGHLLGLAHNVDLNWLMAQGTGVNNQVDIMPAQAVIMRSLAMGRYRGRVVDASEVCP